MYVEFLCVVSMCVEQTFVAATHMALRGNKQFSLWQSPKRKIHCKKTIKCRSFISSIKLAHQASFRSI